MWEGERMTETKNVKAIFRSCRPARCVINPVDELRKEIESNRVAIQELRAIIELIGKGKQDGEV